ncbi:MAG TPA: MFS transporter [Solirubrobacteraceae bacterium]|nr:MFS transporter [Solirubrobacteraceae bacterium]
MAASQSRGQAAGSSRMLLAPLALTQFVASFAGSNMNVAINSIAKDLETTVHGVQTAITLFLLCMAALMIPGSKLTDIFGRKSCLVAGLGVYGTGAVIAALAPGLGVLILGYSAFEGVGSALMIPPIYILATMYYDDVTSRARAFGVISGMGGIGAAAGPLIGGVITTAISWRASFLLQALIVGLIVVLALRLRDPLPADRSRSFDMRGAVLSAGGMLLLIVGILQAGTSTALTVAFMAAGALLLALFFWHVRRFERTGREPLLSMSLFGSHRANLAMITQNMQWLLLMGMAFVVSVFLQVVRGYDAIHTGLIFSGATAGILISSLGAERLAKRREQRTLIRVGFLTTLAGVGLLLGLAKVSSSVLAFEPGLVLLGLGVGTMLTPSVNVVQSSFPEEKQGEISGLSRSVSNLGSSLGTAIAGTILVQLASSGNGAYVAAIAVLAAVAFGGFVVAMLMPAESREGERTAKVAVEPSG